MKQIISTANAPKAIGTYSQAIKSGNTVYISGQIPLRADTMTLVTSDFKSQVNCVFDNLAAIAEAAGGNLSHVVKLTVYLTDMTNFAAVNEIMTNHFTEPYPARAVVAVTTLPKNSSIEIDAVLVLTD